MVIGMAILGAHESIAGGYHKAVETAHALGCDCVQLFTKNSNQWRARPITAAEASQFRDALAASGLSHPLAHNSYLINLASPDNGLWRKSIDAMVEELLRAEALGIPYVVAHPAHTPPAASRPAWNASSRRSMKSTARPGRCKSVACWKPRQGRGPRSAGDSSSWPPSFRRCRILTGWASASTHATSLRRATGWRPRAAIRRQCTSLTASWAWGRVRAFHLNDSLRELGSRVDRHAHIGHGKIGLEGFRAIVRDRRFCHTPMYLETPKGTSDGREWDAINLATLREL